MTGIRTRSDLQALIDTNLPTGTGAVTAANHREVAKSAVDSALYRGDTEIVVISMTLTAPPGGESNLDAYVVAVNATGDWSGQDGNIAIYDNSISPAAWFFHTPADGQAVWNRANDTQYRWDTGASPIEWTAINSTITTFSECELSLLSVSHSHDTNMVMTWAEVEDTDNYFDSGVSTANITAPFTGRYRVTGKLSWAAASAAWIGQSVVRLERTGTSFDNDFPGLRVDHNEPSQNMLRHLEFSGVISLTAGQTFDVLAYQSSTTRNTDTGGRLWIEYLG